MRTSVHDATERRRYERELLTARRRLEQLASVVQASGDAIVLTSPEGVVLAWNPGAERLFGFTADEARGESIRKAWFSLRVGPRITRVLSNRHADGEPSNSRRSFRRSTVLSSTSRSVSRRTSRLRESWSPSPRSFATSQNGGRSRHRCGRQRSSSQWEPWQVELPTRSTIR